MAKSPSQFRQIVDEVSGALDEVRKHLRAILDALLPDGYGARSLGRSFDLERTTAWRCWTIAHVSDPAQSLRAMPGERAWARLLDRLAERGAPQGSVDSLRKAVLRFEHLMSERRIDRSTLRALAAGGLDSTRETASLREARRANCRGNARLYGIQARLVTSTFLMAPGRSPRTAVFGYAGVMDGLRRTRPGLPWPILRRTSTLGHAGAMRYYEAVGDAPSIPWLIRGHSTKGIADQELRLQRRHDVDTIELGDVSEERNGRLRFAHAESGPDTDPLPEGEVQPVKLQISQMLPTDTLVVEFLLHRRVRRHTEPAVVLLGSPITIERLPQWEDAVRLPIETSMKPHASRRLPGGDASLDKAYQDALERVVAAQSHDLDDFESFRFVLTHPPLFSSVVIMFEIDGPPAKR